MKKPSNHVWWERQALSLGDMTPFPASKACVDGASTSTNSGSNGSGGGGSGNGTVGSGV